MPVSTFDMMKKGILMSARPVVGGPFVEKGITVDGSTFFVRTGTPQIPDPTRIMGFTSGRSAAEGRQRSFSWQGTTGVVSIDTGSASGQTINLKIPTTGPDINLSPAIAIPSGARFHLWWGAEQVAGDDVEAFLVTWDATNGVQVATQTATNAFDLEFTTGAGPAYHVFTREDNQTQGFVGDCYREVCWYNMPGALPDHTDPLEQAKLWNAGSITDPDVFVNPWGGTPAHDMHGDADAWNAASFAAGTFTKNGPDVTNV